MNGDDHLIADPSQAIFLQVIVFFSFYCSTFNARGRLEALGRVGESWCSYGKPEQCRTFRHLRSRRPYASDLRQTHICSTGALPRPRV